MKRIIQGREPKKRALYEEEGIRGPIEIKAPTLPPIPPLLPSRKLGDSGHVVRFLLTWMSDANAVPLEPTFRLELLIRLHELRQAGILWRIIKEELPKLPRVSHMQLLGNFLKGRWLDLVVPEPVPVSKPPEF